MGLRRFGGDAFRVILHQAKVEERMSGENRVAWITGGGTGIGLAAAEALAERGWRVAISSRRADNVADAVKKSVAKGGDPARIMGVPLDVSKVADVEAAANAILEKFGRIDLLVNSAGVNVRQRNWRDVSTEGWDQVIGINLDGLMYCMRAVLPTMRAQKTGTIINISSWAGKHVSPLTGPAYSASKHAVVALTHSFNMENFRDNLRACCICPAEVATPILNSRPIVPTAEEQARMLQAEDLAAAIVYVAESPAHVCVNEIVISPTWNRSFLAPAHP
jgi:NADP-dependent 3-hydroxy acid dehydrogenase YdfG